MRLDAPDVAELVWRFEERNVTEHYTRACCGADYERPHKPSCRVGALLSRLKAGLPDYEAHARRCADERAAEWEEEEAARHGRMNARDVLRSAPRMEIPNAVLTLARQVYGAAALPFAVGTLA